MIDALLAEARARVDRNRDDEALVLLGGAGVLAADGADIRHDIG